LLNGVDPPRVFQNSDLLNRALRQADALENLNLRSQEGLVGGDLAKKIIQRLNLQRVSLDVESHRGFIDRRHLDGGDRHQQGHDEGDADDGPAALADDVPIDAQIAEAVEFLRLDIEDLAGRRVRHFRHPGPARR
jgi:hypothetical protein